MQWWKNERDAWCGTDQDKYVVSKQFTVFAIAVGRFSLRWRWWRKLGVHDLHRGLRQTETLAHIYVEMRDHCMGKM